MRGVVELPELVENVVGAEMAGPGAGRCGLAPGVS
jgi:hypothetical protein